MNSFIKRVLLSTALGAVAMVVPARAGMVIENEGDNQSTNNTRATALRINSAKFGRNTSPSVYGNRPTVSISGHILGGDLDWYLVEAGPGPAYFDLDSHPASFTDTSLALYNSAGTLLAHADDGFASGANDPGSRDLFDPFLGVFNIPASGIYYIVVSERPTNNPQNPNGLISLGAQLVRPDGHNSGSFLVAATAGNDTFPFNTPQPPTADFFDTGTYTLNISGNFATFGDFVSLEGIGDVFASARGGASVPGGVDLRILGGNQTSHLAWVRGITDPNALPRPEGFRPVGTTLQAWDIIMASLASQFTSAEIYFGYDEAAVQAAGIAEADLQIYHYAGGHWVGGGMVNPANNEIFFTSPTLSPFVLGTPVPEPSSILLAVLGIGVVIACRAGGRTRSTSK